MQVGPADMYTDDCSRATPPAGYSHTPSTPNSARRTQPAAWLCKLLKEDTKDAQSSRILLFVFSRAL